MDPTRSVGDSSLEKARKRRERHEGQLHRMYPGRAIVVRWMLDEAGAPWIVDITLGDKPLDAHRWLLLPRLGFPVVSDFARELALRLADAAAVKREREVCPLTAAGPGGAVVLGERRAVGA